MRDPQAVPMSVVGKLASIPAGRADSAAAGRRYCAAPAATGHRSATARAAAATDRVDARRSIRSSSGDSHCACDGAYFVCVERRSIPRSPFELNATLNPGVQLRVRKPHDDLDGDAAVFRSRRSLRKAGRTSARRALREESGLSSVADTDIRRGSERPLTTGRAVGARERSARSEDRRRWVVVFGLAMPVDRLASRCRVNVFNRGYPFHPPSIANAEPVTNDASSLARYKAAAAISSGFPIRPMACVAAISL